MPSTATGNQPQPLLTPREFHRALGGKVGRDSIYRLIREDRIRSIRLSPRKTLIPYSEVIDFPKREAASRIIF